MEVTFFQKKKSVLTFDLHMLTFDLHGHFPAEK